MLQNFQDEEFTLYKPETTGYNSIIFYYYILLSVQSSTFEIIVQNSCINVAIDNEDTVTFCFLDNLPK